MKSCKLNPILFALLLLPLLSTAEEDPWALHPAEGHRRVQAHGDELLFVDVRDPVEIMFVGFTDAVDLNIPFRLVNTEELNPQGTAFAMPLNPRFAEEVRAALKAKGLDETATIITMCRTGGARGRPSAEYLRENGFPNVWYVENGFQGEPAEEGVRKGHRNRNGWQNEGLPWRLGFDPEKIHRAP